MLTRKASVGSLLALVIIEAMYSTGSTSSSSLRMPGSFIRTPDTPEGMLTE